MAGKISDHVYDRHYSGVLLVDETDEGLVLVADPNERGSEPTVRLVLNDSQVKKLRLLLTQYERNQKA